MHTFAEASGQRLNLDKVELLQVGDVGISWRWQQLPAEVQASVLRQQRLPCMDAPLLPLLRDPQLPQPPPQQPPAPPQVPLQPPPPPAPQQQQQWARPPHAPLQPPAPQPLQPQPPPLLQPQPQPSPPAFIPHHIHQQMLAMQLPPAPAAVQGLRLVQQHTSLGITFSNDAAPSADWPTRLAEVDRAYDKISRLPLSTFGRAFAASGYGVSKTLYHAEFAGLPPPATRAVMHKHLARLVDRQEPPVLVRGRRPRMTGVPEPMLAGHPLVGGFGALPWVPHMRARHACWTTRLACTALRPTATLSPWQLVARTLLARHHLHLHPLNLLTVRPQDHPLDYLVGGLGRPTWQPLKRLVCALEWLPPVTDISGEPLELGPWVLAAPLWGNPLLPGRPTGEGLEAHPQFGALLSPIPSLQTVGDAILMVDSYVRGPLHPHAQYMAQVVLPLFPYPPSILTTDRQQAHDLVMALQNAIPAEWQTAARAALAAGRSASAHDALQHILPRLGWTLPGGARVFVGSLTVRAATSLQMGPRTERRLLLHDAFLSEVLDLPDGHQPEQAHRDELLALFRAAWKLRWENEHKEILWRLAVDGVPLHANSHIRQPDTPAAACGCGGGQATRAHCFWTCPVAVAVIQVITTQLQRPGEQPLQLTRAHLCLGRAPAGVHRVPWLVVCLAALSAMEWGRRRLRVLMRGGPQPAPQGRGQRRAPGVARAPPAAAADAAVLHFWKLLGSFAALPTLPKGLKAADVPVGHAFFAMGEDGRLAVHRI